MFRKQSTIDIITSDNSYHQQPQQKKSVLQDSWGWAWG